jgi:hypothetical protein
VGGEVVGAHGGEAAAEAADRGANGGDDYGRVCVIEAHGGLAYHGGAAAAVDRWIVRSHMEARLRGRKLTRVEDRRRW